jgi:hypothetical protein
MVLTLADAVAIFNKWKDDAAEILVVIESPFQQSRRGILERGIDWALGLQGQVSEASIDPTKKGKKAGTVVSEPLVFNNRVQEFRLLSLVEASTRQTNAPSKRAESSSPYTDSLIQTPGRRISRDLPAALTKSHSLAENCLGDVRAG